MPNEDNTNTKYWLKLWNDVLDDPKMMSFMDDATFRITIELFLCASKYMKNGLLPDVPTLLFWLHGRVTEKQLKETLKLLKSKKYQIVSHADDAPDSEGWAIVNFYKRQRPLSPAERQKRHRERTNEPDDTDNL